MRDKSTDETEPLPHAAYLVPRHSVRMFRWLCLLSDTTSGAAARLNPQWDDAPLKRVVGGFRDYSCGLPEMALFSFCLLSISKIPCLFSSTMHFRRNSASTNVESEEPIAHRDRISND